VSFSTRFRATPAQYGAGSAELPSTWSWPKQPSQVVVVVVVVLVFVIVVVVVDVFVVDVDVVTVVVVVVVLSEWETVTGPVVGRPVIVATAAATLVEMEPELA